MRELFIERGLENYQPCIENHEPNQITKKALEEIQQKKGLKKAVSVDELFKKLSTKGAA